MNTLPPVRINPWREIAIVMIMMMEVSWITPWFRALTPETYAVDATRVLVILAFIGLFSHALIRIMDYLRLKKSIRQVVMIGFMVLGCLIGIKTMLYAQESVSLSELLTQPIRGFMDITNLIPVEFIIIVAVLIGFWRGISLAQEQIGPSTVVSHFWIGIIMFLAFSFFISIVTGEKAGEFFLLFLFCGLVGVSAARMTILGKVRGSTENQFSASWFGGILMSALIVVGLASLFGIILRDQFSWIGGIFLGLLGSVLILVWAILNPILTFLVTKLSNLLNGAEILYDLEAGINNITNLMSGISNRISSMAGIKWIQAFLARWGITIRMIIFLCIIGIIIAVIIFWISFSLWKDRQRRKDGSEDRSSLPKGNLLQTLIDSLRQGWNRAVISLEGMTDFKYRHRLRAAARIRQIYADLMELCEALGQSRQESQTPLEFLPRLEVLFPKLHPEITFITDAYLGVRYGLLPETKKEVVDVEEAWKKILTSGQETLKKMKQK